MKASAWFFSGIVGASALVSISGCAKALAQDTVKETKGDRDVELTVYKEDFAMVREGRPLDLESGRNKLILRDVSNSLDPTSVLFDWKKGSGDVQVVSNTYELGVGNSSGLMKRLQGKQAEMIWNSDNGKEGDRMKGTLEVAGDGGFVFKTGDKYYVNPNATIVAPSDGTIVALPTVVAEVDSKSKSTSTLDLTYFTRGMSWSADYVAKFGTGAETLNLECWATVTNRTGTSFPNAALTFMAGSPNRSFRDYDSADAPVAAGGVMARKAKYSKMEAQAYAPVAVGEMYAYKATSRASIAPAEMNRVRMFGGEVSVKKDYSVRLPWIGEWMYGNQNRRQSAQLSVNFTNSEAKGLGNPLPQGTVRVYDLDSEGKPVYVGAAEISDTPKNATVSLTLSNVFDVYAEPSVVKTSKVDKHTLRYQISVVLHNEKKSSTDLRLVQPFSGRWNVVDENSKHTKLDTNTAQWIVPIDAGGKATLSYSVDVKN